MMPSNPASWWISGHEKAGFTYEPGPHPFYVVMRSRGYIPLSILVWATDEIHVRKILRGMVDFGRSAAAQHVPRDERIYESQANRKTLLDELSKCLNEKPTDYELTIQQFTPNHPVKVGWASNDTIL